VEKLARGFTDRNGRFRPTGRFKKGSKVQSVIINKKSFPTKSSAKSKVKELGFKTTKVDVTENNFRFRQIDPKKCVQGQFATIPITSGVQAVICEPK